jgi:hypothetical protein
MKKIILTLLLISFLTLSVIGLTTAVEPAPRVGLLEGLQRIINVLFAILVIVAVIFIILGAYSLMTAGGDQTKIETGRTKIIYAIIAVVVAILAWGVIDFVRRHIEGGGGGMWI